MGSASILEPMVYLYRDTGDPKYLRFCEYVVESFESPTGPEFDRTMTTGSKRVCDVEDPFANRAAREMKFKTRSEFAIVAKVTKCSPALSGWLACTS